MNKIVSSIDIANNIRAERNRKNMTQEQVAAVLEVSNKTYATYETDGKNIKATTLCKLAELFNCSIDDFYVQNKSTNCE